MARDNAAEEDKLYRSYRQQSNSTAFNSSNVGRRLEHWVRSPTYFSIRFDYFMASVNFVCCHPIFADHPLFESIFWHGIN